MTQQISPDGKWFWDGHQWLPNTVIADSKETRTGRKMILPAVVVGSIALGLTWMSILVAAVNAPSKPVAVRPSFALPSPGSHLSPPG